MSNIVYKFLPIERLNYIEDELLRITQPGDLNDPFEFLPASPSVESFCKLIENAYKENVNKITNSKLSKTEKSEQKNLEIRKYKTLVRKIRNNEPDNARTMFLERANTNLNTKLGILSLTRRWDSNLMWAHYTNSHKGFCIGFNAKAPFFSNYNKVSDIEKIFMPVKYSDNRISIPMEKGVAIDFQVVFSKSKDWEYEAEERLLVTLNHANKRISNNPYDIYLYKVPHTLIKEIILGMNFPDKSIDKIKEFCKLNEIELFRAKISETKYNMEREKYYP